MAIANCLEKDVDSKPLLLKNMHDFLYSVVNNQEFEKGPKTNAPNSR